MAPCPGHEDRTPSLSIRDACDGMVLTHCHAGCTQAHVIDCLRGLGLWAGNRHGENHRGPRHPRNVVRPSPDTGRSGEMALDIWGTTEVADDTLVATYLRSRGLTRLPSSLRFRRALKHPSGQWWPAMVASVTRVGTEGPVAIHRTFLARDGSGKAPVDPQKMMLGPCRGGAVRLAEPTELLMVGEGIETCLAAMQATGWPAWAALSTSGVRTLVLPSHARDVIVLADSDDSGEAAAQYAAARWKREGRRVRIARPPRGMDFNDLLLAGGVA
jgi:putative DNA primase/helicase